MIKTIFISNEGQLRTMFRNFFTKQVLTYLVKSDIIVRVLTVRRRTKSKVQDI